MQIFELLDEAPCNSFKEASYGVDIDQANKRLFSTVDKIEKGELLLEWLKKSQPCIIGRLGAAKKRGIQISIFVVDEHDIAKGDAYLRRYLGECRRDWKDQCSRGESDAALYFINVEKLSNIPPSSNLLEIFTKISEFIFYEFGTIQSDVIYTEAAPLLLDGKINLYKAGINIFHTTAHLTSNHDRRVPGGMVISVNSVGHYANNMVQQGVFKDVEAAVNEIKKFAWQSIGNGGIGIKDSPSTSWHNIDPINTCPFGERPSTVAENFSIESYSARYHTDILIPRYLTEIPSLVGDPLVEDWKSLTIEYFTGKEYQIGSIDFGMFNGYQVDDEAVHFNPFPPIRAVNSPDLVY